jgi:hypothetical protein
MTPKGPRSERETVINFNEEDDAATIWTASGIIHNRLVKRLGRTYLTQDGERHSEWKVPKRLIRLPMAPKPMSPDRLEALRARSPIRPGGKRASRGITEGQTE